MTVDGYGGDKLRRVMKADCFENKKAYIDFGGGRASPNKEFFIDEIIGLNNAS